MHSCIFIKFFKNFEPKDFWSFLCFWLFWSNASFKHVSLTLILKISWFVQNLEIRVYVFLRNWGFCSIGWNWLVILFNWVIITYFLFLLCCLIDQYMDFWKIKVSKLGILQKIYFSKLGIFQYWDRMELFLCISSCIICVFASCII